MAHRNSSPCLLRSKLATSVGFVLASILSTSLFAQDSAPRLQVRSQLVSLNVVITDKDGHVVPTLVRDDFEVLENGVPQDIRHFEPPHSADAVPLQPTVDEFDRKSWGDAPLTIIVVDEMDTPFADTAYCRQEVDRFLKAQPELLAQPTALLWLSDNGVHPLTDFTRDRKAIQTALDSHKGSLPGRLERGAAVEQLSLSLSAIQQIALFSAANKGPKQIIWIGASFPGIDGTSLNAKQLEIMHNAINSTTDLLMQSQATLYVIDPTPTATPPTTTLSTMGGPEAVTTANYITTDPFLSGFNFMSFVEQTGGKYFIGRNDLNNEIEEGIARGTNFYTISYVPKTPIEKDEYRKIDIRLKAAGLEVQTKQGYYTAPPKPATVADLEFDLHEALISGMPYENVGVRVHGCHLEAKQMATCDVEVDNNSLTHETGPDGSARATIAAAVSALNKNSMLVSNDVVKFTLKLPSQRTAISYTSLPLHLHVPPQTQTIRIAVRDSSGRIGTATLDDAQRLSLISKH